MRRRRSGPRADGHDGRGDAVDRLRCDWRVATATGPFPNSLTLAAASSSVALASPHRRRSVGHWCRRRTEAVRTRSSCPARRRSRGWGSATHLAPTLSLPAVSSNRVTRASPGAPWRSRANPVRLRDEPRCRSDPVPSSAYNPLARAPCCRVDGEGCSGPYLSGVSSAPSESTAPPVR